MTTPKFVVCGSFRRGLEQLARDYKALQKAGCRILSPVSATVASVVDEFTYFEGESLLPPEEVERAHLAAILQADGVWLHAPEGYLGPSAATELGWAVASGVPVYTSETLAEPALRHLVRRVSAPEEAARLAMVRGEFRVPALSAMQAYYSRVSAERGYDSETAMMGVLLLAEELGELARAVRCRAKIARDGTAPTCDVGEELSDILLYVLHIANTVGSDLVRDVEEKERKNQGRFLGRSREKPGSGRHESNE